MISIFTLTSTLHDKAAVDAAVSAGVDKIVYTSSAGAGSEGIDAKAR